MNLSRSRSRERNELPASRLIELVPTSTKREDERYLVRIADHAIELGADFDETTLVRLVRALRSC